MNTFTFGGQLAMSYGVEASGDISSVLLGNIPGSKAVTKSSERDDRSGTDYWIEHVRGTPISVDLKLRKDDPIEKYKQDDLALETWSVVLGSHSRDRNLSAIGWTLDEKKRTDYILWWFKTTKRWVLVPFSQLCHSFRLRKDEWRARFKTREQYTDGGGVSWRSEMVLVPRTVVWEAINDDFGGSPKRQRPHALRRHVDNAPAPTPKLDPPSVIGYTRPEHSGPAAPVVIGVEPAFLQQVGKVGESVNCSIGAQQFTGLIISRTLVRPSVDLPRSSTVRVQLGARKA